MCNNLYKGFLVKESGKIFSKSLKLFLDYINIALKKEFSNSLSSADDKPIKLTE